MQVRNLILIFLCTFSFPSFSIDSRSEAARIADADLVSRLNNGRITFADIVMELVKELKERKLIVLSFGVLGLFTVSLMQKENPDFFNSMVRCVEWPFFITQKKIQQLLCGGQSLTWNEVASWHNRIARLLTPLTKTTSMVDLSKDRRLRIMDQEDGQEEGQDDQWKQQVAHIERECTFLGKMLTIRLAYYDQQRPEKKKKITELQRVLRTPLTVAHAAGKAVIRTSLTRNEEIAFGLKEAISYLKETVEYCKSVSHFSALDKEHMKRLMSSISTTFEHVGVLVDEISAADRNKKKLPMTADGSLSRVGGTYGVYDQGYGDSR